MKPQELQRNIQQTKARKQIIKEQQQQKRKKTAKRKFRKLVNKNGC